MTNETHLQALQFVRLIPPIEVYMKARLLPALSALLVAASVSGLIAGTPAVAKKGGGAPAAAMTKIDKTIPLQVVKISTPIKAGSDASASIKTEPNAMCNITVKYKSGPASAAGLKAQRADKDGNATWTWKVAKNCAPPGEWPVEFTASSKGYKATGNGTLKVEK